MKKNNPHVPILIREGKGVLPRIYARYGELCSLPIQKGFYLVPGDGRMGADGCRPWEGEESVARRYVCGSFFEIQRRDWPRLTVVGLTDKQIEEAVTGLVKAGGA